MQQVPARELKALVDRLVSEGRQPILLDVREDWEVQAARLDLPGATLCHIPMGQIPARLGELDATQPILGLCHHGMRSLQVVAFLSRQGLAETYNITGGIHAWSTEVDPRVPLY